MPRKRRQKSGSSALSGRGYVPKPHHEPEFVDKVTFQDGEVVEEAEVVEKTRRVRNRGLTFAKNGAELQPIFEKIAEQASAAQETAERKAAQRAEHAKRLEAKERESAGVDVVEVAAAEQEAEEEVPVAATDSDALPEDDLEDGFEVDDDFFDNEDLKPQEFTTLAVDVREFDDSDVSVSDEEDDDELERRYVRKRSKALRAKDARDKAPTTTEDPELQTGKQAKPKAAALSQAWSDTHLSKPLLKAVQEMGYKTPTPIQKEAIPYVLLGRDVMGIAQTGSGKTAAFCLPILERLLQSPNIQGRRLTSTGVRGGRAVTKAMMISPTRELAIQTYDVLTNLSRFTTITRALVAGGVDLEKQVAHLRMQPDIVIGTPGRIIDVALNAQNVYFEFLEIMVLDEADRLLDLGFQNAIIHILKQCSTPTRQTLLFSATLEDEVLDLAALALKKPVKVQVNKSHHVCEQLEQCFLGVGEWKDFDAALLHLLTTDKPIKGAKTTVPLLSDRTTFPKIIAFFKTKKSCHRTSIALTQLGIAHFELHGDLSQTQRLQNLRNFHMSSEAVILASDVASRGIDVDNVSAVINLGLPVDTTRYIHRVGRTARIGNSGVAVTVFTQQERAAVKRIWKTVSKKEKGERTLPLPAVKINKTTIAPWKVKLAKIDKDVRGVIREEGRKKEQDKADRLMDLSKNLEQLASKRLRHPDREYVDHGQNELEGKAKLLLDDFMGKTPVKRRKVAT
ncbi:MAG: hypothetical protein KVP17_001424 [Porospora cf. gigantea B]|uniref:uncharacterized protein n=1 Tax=Porospora cf. gigantea B TaxID=2853592 RepID=UPI003571D9A5|nr:MAG: hypothetical protein KVP17_001424 [Porospora cf. gigantea B]